MLTKKVEGVASKRPIVQQAAAQLPSGYAALLEDIKARVRAAQLKAGLAVNRELVLLYWHIGREILARQEREGWGAKVIDRLSRDLSREFPDMRGFSPRNLLFMRAFADGYADETIVKQLVSLLPSGHVVRATANSASGACTSAVCYNVRVHLEAELARGTTPPPRNR